RCCTALALTGLRSRAQGFLACAHCIPVPHRPIAKAERLTRKVAGDFCIPARFGQAQCGATEPQHPTVMMSERTLLLRRINFQAGASAFDRLLFMTYGFLKQSCFSRDSRLRASLTSVLSAL